MSPLVELSDSVEQVDDELTIDIDATFVSCNLIDCLDSVDHYKGILVGHQFVKLLQVVSVVFEGLLVHVEQLDCADDSGLFDVWVRV